MPVALPVPGIRPGEPRTRPSQHRPRVPGHLSTWHGKLVPVPDPLLYVGLAGTRAPLEACALCC